LKQQDKKRDPKKKEIDKVVTQEIEKTQKRMD
jgi:hypothetical protein